MFATYEEILKQKRPLSCRDFSVCQIMFWELCITTTRIVWHLRQWSRPPTYGSNRCESSLLNCHLFASSRTSENPSWIYTVSLLKTDCLKPPPNFITAFMGNLASTYVVSTNATVSRNHRRRRTSADDCEYTSATERRDISFTLWPLYTGRWNCTELNDAEASDASGRCGEEEISTPAGTHHCRSTCGQYILRTEESRLIWCKAPTKHKHG
jgi:hypothetical protein